MKNGWRAMQNLHHQTMRVPAVAPAGVIVAAVTVVVVVARVVIGELTMCYNMIDYCSSGGMFGWEGYVSAFGFKGSEALVSSNC